MNINFGNITYRNDLGQIVSKEEFEFEREKFKNNVREAYENKVIAGSRTCNTTNNELENNLITKYNQLHPENQIPLKITIKEKTKITSNEPKITIISKDEDNGR